MENRKKYIDSIFVAVERGEVPEDVKVSFKDLEMLLAVSCSSDDPKVKGYAKTLILGLSSKDFDLEALLKLYNLFRSGSSEEICRLLRTMVSQVDSVGRYSLQFLIGRVELHGGDTLIQSSLVEVIRKIPVKRSNISFLLLVAGSRDPFVADLAPRLLMNIPSAQIDAQMLIGQYLKNLENRSVLSLISRLSSKLYLDRVDIGFLLEARNANADNIQVKSFIEDIGIRVLADLYLRGEIS